MSMTSAQIDELRRMADGQATYRDARAVMLQAADTITELRGALSVASVDYRHLKAKNAKLRELVRDLWLTGSLCDAIPDMRLQAKDGDWRTMQERVDEALGIEVDK